jgi:hypothetical protein
MIATGMWLPHSLKPDIDLANTVQTKPERLIDHIDGSIMAEKSRSH